MRSAKSSGDFQIALDVKPADCDFQIAVPCQTPGTKKKERTFVLSFQGGDYLLFRFRSTIGVIRFNFSVRNGKRWSPYAMFTLVSFPVPPHRVGLKELSRPEAARRDRNRVPPSPKDFMSHPLTGRARQEVMRSTELSGN